MTPRRHLDDLFTAAYDDELSPIDEARFQTHMQSCAPCAEAYAEFRATVEALRELPPARMPHVVHLPSTLPVAERSVRPRIGLGWFNLGIVRRFPATAIAGAAAVVLLIAALAHGTGGTPTNSPQSLGRPNAAGGAAPGAIPETACSQTVGITGASPPVSFTHQDLATDAAQPALHLVLAAPSLVVSAGKPAYVYAQLSLPVASLSIPGTQATAPPARAVLPCVSISVGNSQNQLAPLPAGSGVFGSPASLGHGTVTAAPAYQDNGAAGPLLAFNVPAGLAPGTEIHITATVPAGYTGPGSPPLTAELTLTTG
ncbi:MAG TPA: zf-HC2 domain-containing protein [Candidatus Dormibacteraeota bacterium]